MSKKYYFHLKNRKQLYSNNLLIKEEKSRKAKIYYQNNKEKIKSKMGIYVKNNEYKVKQTKQQYYKNNKTIINNKKKPYMKEYMQRPDVKIRQKSIGKRYRIKHLDKIKEKNRLFMKEYNKKPEVKLRKKLFEQLPKSRIRQREHYQKCKQKENQERKELELPLIGERRYYNETKLFIYLSSLFKYEEMIRNNRSLLDGLELDIYIPSLKLAFEYNGIQHYEFRPLFHKTYQDFEIQQLRDKRRQELCQQNGIKLIIFRYDEELSLQLVLSKLKENNIPLKTQTEIKQFTL